MWLAQRPRQAVSQYARTGQRRAARCIVDGRAARTADAIGNGSRRPLARYGQNDCAIALNRKNALFAGPDGGAEHWAVIASLIETCKLIAVEPRGYLADVITRIVNGHPQSRLDELLPWGYVTTVELSDVA